jgi:hypothetical protein
VIGDMLDVMVAFKRPVERDFGRDRRRGDHWESASRLSTRRSLSPRRT